LQDEFNASLDDINILIEDVYVRAHARFGHLNKNQAQKRGAEIQAFANLAWAEVATENQAMIDAGKYEYTVSPQALGAYMQLRAYFQKQAQI